MMTRLEAELTRWDGVTPLRIFYGNTGVTLANNAQTVRKALMRLGIVANVRAESATESVVVEPLYVA